MQPVKDPEKVAAARESRLKLATAALGLVTAILAALTAMFGLTAKQATNKADDSEQRVQALQSGNAVLATQSAEAQQTIAALQSQRSASPAPVNAPVGSAAPDVLFEGQVTLKAGTGADFEAKQTTGVRADGPTGDLDIYHDQANAITANGGDLYPDRGPTKEAAARCAEVLEAEVDGVAGDGTLNPGDRFCLRTSQERVAWARVNSVVGTASSHVVVLDVVVWQ